MIWNDYMFVCVHAGEEKEFGYQLNSENGPSRWGELEPEWRTCSNGTKQSPINILKQSVKTVTHLGELDRDYRPSNATLKNKGHDMMVFFCQKYFLNIIYFPQVNQKLNVKILSLNCECSWNGKVVQEVLK